MFWLKVHNHQLLVAKGSDHLQLVRSDFPLWSAVQRACSSLAQCTSVIRVLCQALEPTALFVYPVYAAVAEDAVPAHSSATTGHGNSSELCRRSRPIPQIMILVFPAFTLSPFSLHCFIPSQEPDLTHSSRDSTMITRSLAQRSSQGTPERNFV